MAEQEKVQDDIAASMAATKADYVRLGNSGLKVSVPLFGCMSFGSKAWAPWAIEGDEAMDLLKAAYDRGLNTWDTANIYSNGVSEELIGKALKKFQIPRHKVVIMTKAFATVGEKPETKTLSNPDVKKTKDYVNQGGLSASALFTAVNASLKRLDTDYIDVLQIHRFDKETPIEETMRALNDLVRSGKVRYIGASSMWTYQFAQMQFCAEKNGWTKFISMQNHFSLLYQEELREMIPFCRDTGVGLIPWGPLHAGMLARPVDKHATTDRSKDKPAPTEQEAAIVGRVKELADKKGWTMTQVALAWTMHSRNGVSSPIVGFSSVERIDEALAVRGKQLTDEDMDFLAIYKPIPIQGHS